MPGTSPTPIASMCCVVAGLEMARAKPVLIPLLDKGLHSYHEQRRDLPATGKYHLLSMETHVKSKACRNCGRHLRVIRSGFSYSKRLKKNSYVTFSLLGFHIMHAF